MSRAGAIFERTLDVLLFVPDRVQALAGNVVTAIIQIWANKIRSLLTVLGIIIAVTSIISVVSMVEGFGDYVTSFLRGLGTNMMVVYPEWLRGPRGEYLRPAEMTIEDIYAVDSNASAIRRTSPVIWQNAAIEYGRRQLTGIQLRATNERFQPIRNFYVDAGRFFGAIDVESGAPVCVLGREVLRKLEMRRIPTRRLRPHRQPTLPGHRTPRSQGQLHGR